MSNNVNMNIHIHIYTYAFVALGNYEKSQMRFQDGRHAALRCPKEAMQVPNPTPQTLFALNCNDL